MKQRDLIFWFYNLMAFLCVAFAAQVAVVAADPRFGDHINQVAPVFGVAIGIVLVGGLRYLPAIFLGALLPAYFAQDGLIMILSVPLATVATAALCQRLLQKLHVRMNLERIRDALILVFCGLLISTCFGSVIESVFQCRGHEGIRWEEFTPIVSNQLARSGCGLYYYHAFYFGVGRSERLSTSGTAISGSGDLAVYFGLFWTGDLY